MNGAAAIIDEREVKKQRRKQSNRESARRSRLRKQAECEELSSRVNSLQQQNGALTAELAAMRRKCEELAAENGKLQRQLSTASFRAEEAETVKADVALEAKPKRGK